MSQIVNKRTRRRRSSSSIESISSDDDKPILETTAMKMVSSDPKALAKMIQNVQSANTWDQMVSYMDVGSVERLFEGVKKGIERIAAEAKEAEEEKKKQQQQIPILPRIVRANGPKLGQQNAKDLNDKQNQELMSVLESLFQGKNIHRSHSKTIGLPLHVAAALMYYELKHNPTSITKADSHGHRPQKQARRRIAYDFDDCLTALLAANTKSFGYEPYHPREGYFMPMGSDIKYRYLVRDEPTMFRGDISERMFRLLLQEFTLKDLELQPI